ncbi:S-adenosyl-L-methionine-dependent methyltransferase [Tribonema minus]|uniref:DNA (cytosine-5-)-methyltransferase n=1 Tax=Tribonema minus TaxID=303371 RepID=A0A835Z4N3_9STRA|nr:S-adenosyl-L-methionine-dependent methyltransferase [Tribonema minus]
MVRIAIIVTATGSGGMIYLIDLFCGAGGFSEGARQAGAVVMLAVDCWKAALDVHAANHGDCEHWNEPLGGSAADFAGRLKDFIARKVPPGDRVHLHASPPCQNLSQINRRRQESIGLSLVAWCLDVVDLSRRRVIFGHAPVLQTETAVSAGEALAQLEQVTEPNDRQCNGSTFPANYFATCAATTACRRMIGNALPPAFAQRLVNAIAESAGFSEGARQAGATVVLAVDSWRDALDAHAVMHLNCTHWCEELGGDPSRFAKRLRDFIGSDLPADARVHVHASPPCQNLSAANPGRDESEGLRLVEWTFSVFDRLTNCSFTLEQVSSRPLMEAYGHLPHVRYDLSNHGVPQTRKRVVFGDAPHLLAEPAVSMRDALTDGGAASRMTESARQTSHSIATSNPTTYKTRSVNQPAYTVTQQQPQIWHRHAVGECSMLSIPQLLVLQTFPKRCLDAFPVGMSAVQRRQAIANAVPPAFAKRLMASLAGS